MSDMEQLEWLTIEGFKYLGLQIVALLLAIVWLLTAPDVVTAAIAIVFIPLTFVYSLPKVNAIQTQKKVILERMVRTRDRSFANGTDIESEV